MTLAQTYKQQFGKVSYPFQVYDANGKLTYHESSDGYWAKYGYDAKGNRTYYENSDGYWSKHEYDSNGNKTYFENSEGCWSKREYNANGYRAYFENSDGRIEGQKQTIEIDGVEDSAEQVRERIAELKPIKDK